ncbi:MAG TPA: hypothetical protein VMH01_07430 [Puia sp.]|nr:hypothetical protein [Puia sp.]
MKKSIITIALAGIMLSLSFSNAHAQFAVKADKSESTPGNFKAVSSDKVNGKAIRQFQHDYKEVVNSDWSVLKDGGFLCRFIITDVPYRALYNPGGQWLYTISNYSGRQLSQSLRDKIQSSYYNYQITFVNQIDMPENKTIYLVEIQDEKSIKKVRVTDEEMEIVLNIRK